MTPTVEDYVALVEYMLSCARRRDWHGVSDAANDLRVAEALNPKLTDLDLAQNTSLYLS